MISNSTPLICLAKIDKLDLLNEIFGKIKITTSVKDEVLISGRPGYAKIKEAIDKGWIKVIDPKESIEFGIGKGENSIINLSRETKEDIIIDDAFAVKIAKSLNIKFIRTTGVIILALKNRIIKKAECKELINKLIKNGYYISPSIYVELIKIIDEGF